MKKILLAVDSSQFSLKAAEKTVDLAKAMDAEVTVMAVAETPGVSSFDLVALIREKIELETEELLEKMKNMFEGKGLQVKTMLEKGHAASTICEALEKYGFDLVSKTNKS